MKYSKCPTYLFNISCVVPSEIDAFNEIIGISICQISFFSIISISGIFSFSGDLQGGALSQGVPHVSMIPLYSFWVTVHFPDLKNHF